MFEKDPNQRSLRNFLLAGAAASVMVFQGAALAQEPVVEDSDDLTADDLGMEPTERMAVTGSRILRDEFSAPSPILTIGEQEVDQRGVVLVEDLINTLPQLVAAQTSELANGTAGTASIDLRGLGANRTLTLLDGKRLPYGSTSIAAPNVDIIPTQLIERVEIVTGGASAAYGSDAVAGVVNFILKNDFEGIEVDATGSLNFDANDNDFAQQVLAASENPIPGSTSDGFQAQVAVTMGANTADGKGNVTLHFAYLQQGEVRQGDRDVSACALGGNSGPQSVGGVGCVGSSTFRRFFSAGDTFQQPDGTLVPFVGGPEQTFNFGPDNFFQRPLQRFTIYGRAHYEVWENTEAYLDVSYVNNRSDAQIAFSGSFFRPFQVNCDNPLLNQGLGPDGEGEGTYFDLLGCETDDAGNPVAEDVGFSFGRRNVEGDPRNTFREIATWRTVGGLRGSFWDDNFNWDLFGQYARTNLTDISTNDLNFNRVQDALFVVDDGNGNPVCRSGNAGCVPYDVFSRPGGQTGVTQEAVDFIQGTGLVNGFTTQTVVGGTVQGDFTDYGMVSPYAETGIAILGGFEIREDFISRTPDDVRQIPGGQGLTGVGGGTLPIEGQVRVWEIFGEAEIPLIQGMRFADELTINAQYRYSSYTTDGAGVENEFDTNTWSAGGRWAPVPDFVLRGQYQRAVRAPNIFDLFLDQNTGLVDFSTGPNGLFDPCAGDFDPATQNPEPARTFEECARTGVTADQFGNIPDNPAGQFNTVTGGNPQLGPETATTVTLGAVINPRWLPDLTLTIDYFDVVVEDAIGTIPAVTSVETCLDTGDPTFCNLIVRDQFGSLFLDNSNFEGIQTTNVNIAELQAEGVDFALLYNYDLGSSRFGDLGGVSINFAGTYLRKLNETPLPGAEAVECAGFYGGSCARGAVDKPSTPEWRHRLVSTWMTPFFNTDFTFTWRYVGAVDFQPGNATNVLDPRLDAENYFDLAAIVNLHEGFAFRVGVNNLMDNDPPLTTVAGTAPGNGNTYPGVYDSLGRQIFAGVNIKF